MGDLSPNHSDHKVPGWVHCGDPTELAAVVKAGGKVGHIVESGCRSWMDFAERVGHMDYVIPVEAANHYGKNAPPNRRGPLTTWRAELAAAMVKAEDDELIAVAPDWDAFDVEFHAGYGSSSGPPVLAWTERRVYFPVTYDGSEWMDSAPRDPVSDGQRHVGGE